MKATEYARYIAQFPKRVRLSVSAFFHYTNNSIESLDRIDTPKRGYYMIRLTEGGWIVPKQTIVVVPGMSYSCDGWPATVEECEKAHYAS